MYLCVSVVCVCVSVCLCVCVCVCARWSRLIIQPGFQQKRWEAGEEGRLVRQGPAALGPSPNSQDHWENTYPSL